MFLHQGERFQNDKLSSCFIRSIQRTDGGTYLIVIPPYSYPFVVADAPRQVRHIRQDDARVWLVLSDEQEQILDPSTLSYVPDRGLYCQVDAPGVQRWPARFLRPAYYALLSHIDQQGEDYFSMCRGRWPIPVVSAAAALNRCATWLCRGCVGVPGRRAQSCMSLVFVKFFAENDDLRFAGVV